MANSWLRLWHDMPNDPKWRTIAKISGQSIALVQAVYLQLLVSASQNPEIDETGVTLHVVTVTNEDIASALDVTVGNVDCVTDAMQGRVLNGKTISGWDKRQAPSANHKNPGKPAKSGAQRIREYRERKKLEAQSNKHVTKSNVTETLRNDVTPQIRKEEIREEVKDKPKNLLSEAEKKQPQTIEPVPPEEIFITLPLAGGSTYPVSLVYIQSRRELYPAVDIQQELRNMFGWLESNPTKRKTPKGIKRFITTWLQKCQDNPRNRQVIYGQNIPGTGGSSAARAVRLERERIEREQAEYRAAERVEIMGNPGGNLRESLVNEEWVTTINAMDCPDF